MVIEMANAASSAKPVDKTKQFEKSADDEAKGHETKSLQEVIKANFKPIALFFLMIAMAIFVGDMAQLGLYLKPDLFGSVVMLVPVVIMVAGIIGYIRNRAVPYEWKNRAVVGTVFVLTFIIIGILVLLGVIQPMYVYGLIAGNFTLGFDYDESGFQMIIRLITVLVLAALGTFLYASVVFWMVSKPDGDKLSREIDEEQSKIRRAIQRASASVERFIRENDIAFYSVLGVVSIFLGMIPAGHSVVVNLGF